ncbi:MAG: hypothetical protein ACKV2U_12910 [Bryobacteraceae bacterium]
MDVNDPNDITAEMKHVVQNHYALTHVGEENFIGAVLIFPEVSTECERIAARILETFPAYRNRFAFDDIKQRLRKIVTNTVRSGRYERADELMDGFWKRLENPDERKACYVPLIGIKLQSRDVEIGRFRLLQMDLEHIAEVVELMNASIDLTSNSADHKVIFKSQEEVEIRDYLAGTVCLRVEVVADTNKADQIALRDAVMLLDLLRFTIPALYAKGRNIVVGLKGDGQPGIYRRYVLPLGRSDGSFPSYRIGPFGDLEVNEPVLQKMDELGVLSIASAKSPLTALQSAIFRSVHWFAESQLQRTEDNELVNLVIALESLFELPHTDKNKTEKVCEATAVLLESDEAPRKTLFSRLRNACFYRGEVVHQGDHVPDYRDMDWMRETVQAVIGKMIHRMADFLTPNDALDWVSAQNAGIATKVNWRKPTRSRTAHIGGRNTAHGRTERFD